MVNIEDLEKISINTIKKGVEPKYINETEKKDYIDRVTSVMDSLKEDKETIKENKKIVIKARSKK